MLKPNNKIIERWIKAKSEISFRFHSGMTKQGVINDHYRLGYEVDFKDGEHRFVTFDSLISITETIMVEK